MYSLNPGKDSEHSHCSYPAVGCGTVLVMLAAHRRVARVILFTTTTRLWAVQITAKHYPLTAQSRVVRVKIFTLATRRSEHKRLFSSAFVVTDTAECRVGSVKILTVTTRRNTAG